MGEGCILYSQSLSRIIPAGCLLAFFSCRFDSGTFFWRSRRSSSSHMSKRFLMLPLGGAATGSLRLGNSNPWQACLWRVTALEKRPLSNSLLQSAGLCRSTLAGNLPRGPGAQAGLRPDCTHLQVYDVDVRGIRLPIDRDSAHLGSRACAVHPFQPDC